MEGVGLREENWVGCSLRRGGRGESWERTCRSSSHTSTTSTSLLFPPPPLTASVAVNLCSATFPLLFPTPTLVEGNEAQIVPPPAPVPPFAADDDEDGFEEEEDEGWCQIVPGEEGSREAGLLVSVPRHGRGSVVLDKVERGSDVHLRA